MTASHDGSVIYSHIARTDDNADASEVSTASASEDWKRHVTGATLELLRRPGWPIVRIYHYKNGSILSSSS